MRILDIGNVDEFVRKEGDIKKEVVRLRGIFKDIEKRKLKVVDGLIDECAFMRVELHDLRASIIAHGVVDEMPQGDYSILRESPYVRTYHTMIQRYTTAMNNLLALLPKTVEVPPDDGFDSFVCGRDD